ncbi:MAG: GntR family transcriptional regulator, partial [Alphaproteobacteria bacterium]|nr:GntR family transcriptional regulator [Alphaproteobacteria bacterium]
SMSPGERLPPERKLSADFDIARETLRRSLDDLARDGYLERRLGAGTFVTRPKITKQFRVTSFTEDMRQRGLVPSSRVIASMVSKAGGRLGGCLRIPPAEDVITIQRLRLADGLSMAIETLSTPRDLVPGLEGAELENRSFYEILSSRYGMSVVGTHQTIEATVTDDEESTLLEVPPQSPALLFERTSWSTDQRIIEHVRSVYRGDRYKFEIESVRQPSPTVGG